VCLGFTCYILLASAFRSCKTIFYIALQLLIVLLYSTLRSTRRLVSQMHVIKLAKIYVVGSGYAVLQRVSAVTEPLNHSVKLPKHVLDREVGADRLPIPGDLRSIFPFGGLHCSHSFKKLRYSCLAKPLWTAFRDYIWCIRLETSGVLTSSS
jgi:predicted membrane channel-forming protein YqfA (hemolysin III family)